MPVYIKVYSPDSASVILSETSNLSPLNLSDDFSLVQMTLKGDLSGFDELMRRYQSALLIFLKQQTGDQTSAEDLVQETFLKAYQNLDKFNGAKYDSKRAFSTWLFTIARRLFLNENRSAAGKARLSARKKQIFDSENGRDEFSERLKEIPDPLPETDALVVYREQHGRLWSWVKQQLTDDQWSALWLRYTEDYSVKQIGQILDKSPGGVKSLLARAKESLAKSAKKLNLSWDSFAGID